MCAMLLKKCICMQADASACSQREGAYHALPGKNRRSAQEGRVLHPGYGRLWGLLWCLRRYNLHGQL